MDSGCRFPARHQIEHGQRADFRTFNPAIQAILIQLFKYSNLISKDDLPNVFKLFEGAVRVRAEKKLLGQNPTGSRSFRHA